MLADLHFHFTAPAVVVAESSRVDEEVSFGSTPLYVIVTSPALVPTDVTYLPWMEPEFGRPALALLPGKRPIDEYVSAVASLVAPARLMPSAALARTA